MHIYFIEDAGKDFIPFRYFNYWQAVAGFMSTLKDIWGIQVPGHPMFQVVKEAQASKVGSKTVEKGSL